MIQLSQKYAVYQHNGNQLMSPRNPIGVRASSVNAAKALYMTTFYLGPPLQEIGHRFMISRTAAGHNLFTGWGIFKPFIQDLVDRASGKLYIQARFSQKSRLIGALETAIYN
jgi:hypothetical protein